MNTKKIMKTVTGKVLPATVGGIGAKFAKNLSGKVTQNPKLRAAIPLLIGILLCQSAKTETVGLGMCAVGGADLAGTFLPAIAGLEDTDLSGLFGNDTLNDGYDVGSYDVGGNDTLNGFDDGGEMGNYGDY
jgi:hypothetical protein